MKDKIASSKINVFIWGLRDCNVRNTNSARIESLLWETKEVRVFKEERRDLHKLFEAKFFGVGIATVTLIYV